MNKYNSCIFTHGDLSKEEEFMTTVNPNTYKSCALCKRWEGNASLTNQGAGRGLVRFNTSARGRCNLSRNTRLANEGTGCGDFSISFEADRFRL